MSMLINGYKKHENMLIGYHGENNMLIEFEKDVVGETSTAVQLAKVSYEEDTGASFKTFPPDELQTINNLQTSTAMTIHNYIDPDETPRFGFYKYSTCQQNPVRIWAYENDTKVFTETYPSNTLSLYTTLQKYQKIDSYNFATGETLFSNKPLSCGFQGSMGRALNLSHARGKVFQDNSRRTVNDIHLVSHYDNNTVKYQTSTSQNQQTITLSKNQEFTFTSALTNPNTDFWTIHSTEDISVFASGIAQDHDTVYPSQNINDQGILTGLQNTPVITVWDTANPTGTPTYQLIVNYSDGTTNTTYTNAGTTIALGNKNYQDGFARVYLTGTTSSTVHIYCGSEGDGSGNNSTNAIPIKFLSSRIQFDISIDNPSHIQHVAFGIQFSTGVDTINEYETNLGFTGEATPNFIQQRTAFTSNTQPDNTKLLHWRLGTDIDKHLYDTTHTTTLFYIVTQIDGGEEAITGTCDNVRSVENASEYTINSRTALSLNHSGLSQNIGTAISGIYDTTPFGITTLAVFSRNNTEMNNPWFKLSGHSSYFSIVRYSSTNAISLQFRGTTYVNDILITFNFASPTNPYNHLVWGSVKQIGDTDEYELHCELWSFTTSGSATQVDSQTATITLAYNDAHPSFSETDYLVGMDINTGNPIDISDYGSITIGETRHYKGNFITADKDQLIQDIITYWET